MRNLTSEQLAHGTVAYVCMMLDRLASLLRSDEPVDEVTHKGFVLAVATAMDAYNYLLKCNEINLNKNEIIDAVEQIRTEARESVNMLQILGYEEKFDV